MKLNFCMGVAMAALLNGSVYANDPNDWSSGGGKAVACYKADGSLVSAELLDLYEARTLFGQPNIQTDETDFKKILDAALRKLKWTGYDLVGIETAKQRLETLLKNLVFISPDERLVDIDDDYSQVAVPQACKKEQIAIYGNDTVRIDLRLWSLLNPIDQAGLLLHESIYWLERNIKKIRDSRRARRVVALTLDKSVFFGDVKKHGNGGLVCNSFGNNKEGGNYVFTVNRDFETGKLFIDFSAIDGEMVLSRKTLKIPSDINFPFNKKDREGRTVAFSGKTESQIEGDDILSFPAENNQLSISGMKSSYPVRTYTSRKFHCFKTLTTDWD